MSIRIGNNNYSIAVCDENKNYYKIDKIISRGVIYYSSAKPVIVTYMVDSDISYQEEINKGESCLNPTTFTPTKTGYEFVGWREDNIVSSSVLTTKIAGKDPIILYAVFRKKITVTYYNDSTTKSTSSSYCYYNNGNSESATFKLSQNNKSGWEARGWGKTATANSTVTYNDYSEFNISEDVTLYGLYQQIITLTYIQNNSTLSKTGIRYYNSIGNIINPKFTITNPTKTSATFIGWSTSKDTTVEFETISNKEFAANYTLYAVFSYSDLVVYNAAYTLDRTYSDTYISTPTINNSTYVTTATYKRIETDRGNPPHTESASLTLLSLKEACRNLFTKAIITVASSCYANYGIATTSFNGSSFGSSAINGVGYHQLAKEITLDLTNKLTCSAYLYAENNSSNQYYYSHCDIGIVKVVLTGGGIVVG